VATTVCVGVRERGVTIDDEHEHDEGFT